MATPKQPTPPGPPGGDDEASVELLRRAQQGDGEAMDRLLRRFVAPLTRWAAGRLPRWARVSMETDDMVQETIIKALPALQRFQPNADGAVQAYLRRSVKNRIVDEIRKAKARPALDEVDSRARAPQASPLEELIGAEAIERYEAALARLSEDQQHAIVARIELGLDYSLIARELGKPTPDAARMAVSRAMVRLAKEMGRER